MTPEEKRVRARIAQALAESAATSKDAGCATWVEFEAWRETLEIERQQRLARDPEYQTETRKRFERVFLEHVENETGTLH